MDERYLRIKLRLSYHNFYKTGSRKYWFDYMQALDRLLELECNKKLA